MIQMVLHRIRLFTSVLVIAFVIFPAGLTQSHPFEITEIDVSFLKGGWFKADITFHVDAMLAEVPIGDLTDEQYVNLRAVSSEELERRLELVRQFFIVMTDIRFDGERVVPDVSFPNMEVHTSENDGTDEVVLPGHLVRMRGKVPSGAGEFVFKPPPVLNLVVLRIQESFRGETHEQLLDPTDSSQPYFFDQTAETPRWSIVAIQYWSLGFQHILPKGFDHILFVIGLYLLSNRFTPLLWQVTAFTVAHTLTLALSMYGIVSAPERFVEFLVASSITYVAVENIVTSKLKPWRVPVVFGFGLLHGLGFAEVLRDLGLPTGRFVTALVTFNLGVELGQLAVIVFTFIVIGWFRGREWYRARVVIPISIFIGVIGGYLAVSRISGFS